MKTKSILLGAAALVLAASCSNDEVVNIAPQSGAIGFSSFVNNSTRATDNTGDNVTDLKVWGIALQPGEGQTPYNVFAGEKVSKTSDSNRDETTKWSYDVIRYWAVNNSYTFTAVAPASAVLEADAAAGTAGAKVTSGTGMTKGAVASIAFTNDGTIDLLYDAQNVAAQTSSANYGTVSFDLRHILSRVRFEFLNGLNGNYKIEVSDLKITNAMTSGTFTTGETELWNATDANGINFVFGETADNSGCVNFAEYNGIAKSQPSYLFPATQTEYTVSFEVELFELDAKTKNWVSVDTYTHSSVKVPKRDYVLGYSYVLKTTINAENVDPTDEKEPIEFTATVEKWIDDENKPETTVTEW